MGIRYNQAVKDYVSNLEVNAKTKRELYTILRGGIYFSMDKEFKKNNSLKGKKTFSFEDGTKQRVDTYEGRLKAAGELLKREACTLDRNLVRKEISELIYTRGKGYLIKESSKLNDIPLKSLENGLNLPPQESLSESCNNGAVSRFFNWWSSKCPACKLVKNYAPKTAEKLANSSSKLAEVLDTEIVLPKGLTKKILYGACGLAILGATLGTEIVVRNVSSQNYLTQQKTEERGAKKQYTQGSFLNSFSRVKEEDSKSKEKPKKEYVKESNREEKINQQKGNAKPNLEIKIQEPKVLPKIKTENSTLPAYRLIYNPEGYLSSVLENYTKSPSNNIKKNLEVAQIKNQDNPFSISSDLEKYLHHSNLRNAQIIVDSNGKNDISINPLNFGVGVVDSFTPLINEVSSYEDLGYSKSDFKRRGENTLNGLKKAGNGVAKLATLGFLDFRTQEEKEEEGNQALRFLKSIYDPAFGAIESATNTIDFVTGGITNKTVSSLGSLFSGTIESGIVNTGNYASAIVGKGSKELEGLIFSNSGEVSQKSYEIFSTIPRFAANVINHEVAREGKTTQVYIKGEKVSLNKGEIGATLELSSSFALDTLGILSVSGAFNSGNVGGSFSNNGGIIGGPGTGGNVGGGL